MGPPWGIDPTTHYTMSGRFTAELPHGLLVSISSNEYFMCADMMVHITAFNTPVVDHWLEREIAQWVN